LPSQDEHFSQAAHNESTALLLLQHRYFDWAITAFFYAALHLVEAILAQSGEHSRNHVARDSTIARHPALRAIYGRYRYLETLSRDARYLVKPIGHGEMTTVQEKFAALKSRLQSASRI
jgi:hypothetical protein